MPTQFLAVDVEQALVALLVNALPGVDVSVLGEAELNDNDELILKTPCARPRYIESSYRSNELTQTTYDCEHIYDIWCADENLSSKAAQRGASKVVVGRVQAALAGATITLPDGSSEPVRLVGVGSFPEDELGMIYLVRIAIPGLAQFPGGSK